MKGSKKSGKGNRRALFEELEFIDAFFERELHASASKKGSKKRRNLYLDSKFNEVSPK